MHEIAKDADINQALLHYYYRSKEKLFQAVFAEAVGRIIPRLLDILQSDEPLEDKVPRFIHSYIDLLRANPYMPGFVIRELSTHPEKLRNIFGAVDPDKPVKVIEQYEAGVRAGRYLPVAGEQFLVTLIASCVFPFVARPIVQMILRKNDAEFDRFLEERKTAVTAVLLSMLHPKESR